VLPGRCDQVTWELVFVQFSLALCHDKHSSQWLEQNKTTEHMPWITFNNIVSLKRIILDIKVTSQHYSSQLFKHMRCKGTEHFFLQPFLFKLAIKT